MADSAPKSHAPRIAIKFGALSSAGSKSSSNGTKPSSTLGKRQRPNALHHGSDSSDEDDTIGKHEVVSTIGTDAIASRNSDVSAAKRRNKEHVISSLKNRDWKADAKAKRGDRDALPRSSSSREHNIETAPVDQDKDVRWGLNITKRPTQESSPSLEDDKPEERKGGTLDATTSLPHSPRDADKNAMDALLGKRNPAQDLVISDSTLSTKPQFSEQDAYQRSVQEAAEVSTIEEYSGIPEGEFGAAMLRGMGWKGEEFGTKPKEVKRRPHLMGLGSKEDEEIKKAELAKRHGHRERRPRLDEYRRDREKDKHVRDGRYRDSYKSEREQERREQSHEHRNRDRYRDRDSHSHRSRGQGS
jgi:hypothetical protein